MKPEMQSLSPAEKAIILMCEQAPQPMATIQGVLRYLAGTAYLVTAGAVRMLCARGFLRREGLPGGYRATSPLNEWTDTDYE